MKLELELLRAQDKNYFLSVKATTATGEEIISHVPLHDDPLYLLYKKISVDFTHWDAILNAEGLAFRAQQNESKEENTVPTESSQTPATA